MGLFYVVFVLVLSTHVQGQINFSASSNCLEETRSIQFSCVVNPLNNNIDWKKDGIVLAVCPRNVNNNCVKITSEASYSFGSVVATGTFTFNITALSIGRDNGTYSCSSGSSESDEILLSKCECTVQSVANGKVSTSESTVSPGEEVDVTCNKEYTINGSSSITCQADETWNPEWPTCYRPPCQTVICWILAIVAIVLIILLVVINICLIECECLDLPKTELKLSSYGLRALLPGCCICGLAVIIHIIVYFVELDDVCDTVECLVLPLIVIVLMAAVGLVIIAICVCVRAGNKGTKLQKNNTAGKQIGSSDDTISKL